jgi:peptidoglycan-N-acetylglucosamine deacetylase
MEYLNTFIYFSWLLFILLGARVFLFLVLSFHHYRKNRYIKGDVLDYDPMVSVIVPCFNEEKVLENCIDSLIKQDYSKIEIIIVDDGSKDKTKEIGLKLKRKHPKIVKFYSKPNGGKASALNHGILRSKGEIIISIDADSIFVKDTVRNLVIPFNNKRITAVAGNVKVANRSKLINKQQAMEYISGLNLQRRSFAILGCPQVISGAIGAFRRDSLMEIGGYSEDTIVEDMDVTISLLEKGGVVEYNGNAIAYTEAPETIKDFIKQRQRWVYGGFQVLLKHKHLIFNPKYKSLGVLGIPYFLLFPWIDVFISILFIITLIKAVIFLNFIEFIAYFLIISSLQLILLTYTVFIDKEDEKLAFLAFIEGFWYNHLISLVIIKAGFNFIKGSTVSWNKLERLGKNVAPNTALSV